MFLLSQLAYDLYSTLSSGREAASRDLKELEGVLFSLRCALDHLKDVSGDVLAKPGLQHGGSALKEKLDMMIGSCASTLQELDTVTKKYRDAEIQANKGKTKLRTLDDVRKSMKVNWQRVRWDREKQSLQQYREKLKSHTDAINLMLTSIVWANTAFANANSKKNHDRTHSLLDNVLRTTVVDPEIRSLVEEMHGMLTNPTARPQTGQMKAKRSMGLSHNQVDVTANSLSGPSFEEAPNPKPEDIQMATMQGTASPHDQLGTVYPFSEASFDESSVPIRRYRRSLPVVSLYAMTSLPERTARVDEYARPTSTGVSTRGLARVPSWIGQDIAESASKPSTPSVYHTAHTQNMGSSEMYHKFENLAESTFRHERLTDQVKLPAATVQLNNERRAFGAREYEAFKQRYTKPKKFAKPSLLTSVTPSSRDLQACIPHIFQSTAEGKQQTQERKNDITRWAHEFSRYINDTNVTQSNKDGHILRLLGALNEAVESSTGKMRKLFYETSDSAGFTSVLSQIETMSKSVRVMKEIEEFQDTKGE
ncbi:uncharacterized protein J4E84_007441 [Alternaria hordeiaustralica]|uniref:uncharacterized protein n=1 Tax=Alternaria hordeiaustralica TaxID=1187925 RepID=UPI0020C2837E|nr:uncharacterized protein J4E84_007441 [Alternaria hordeiaustralica]KAI4681845.1 hypothetical protein J4E84_007441 [Alternaria hordeiaustralica]